MPRTAFALALGICWVLAGCKSANDDAALTQSPPTPGQSTTGTQGGGTAPITGLQLDLAAEPALTWNPANGKTTLVTQFAVRDNTGAPLQESDFNVAMLVDDAPLDNESLLAQSAQDLAVNIHFSMVLDASFSMTQHTPPAFEPMKEAARASYQSVLDTWAQRPGDAKFSLIWFSEVLNQGTFNTNTNRDWRPDDLLAIPTPTAGTATKLLASVRTMAQYMNSQYQSGVFNGPRDQYVMLVFSDGKDNYSWFDNSSVDGTFSTTSGATYRQFGATAATLDDVKAVIQAHPRLTVHVIGLGSAIDRAELQAIAAAGGGVFLENPSSKTISDLFDRVMREFLTIQTRGAEIPLPPADYKFTLRVSNKAGNLAAQKSYTFRAGDSQARILGSAD